MPFHDDRFKINRFIRLKKILHKYDNGQSQWSIRSRSRNVAECCGGRPFKWGFHAVYHRVGWGGDVIFGWKDNSHRSDIDTHTANTMSRSQWSLGNGHFVWPSLPFAVTELGGVMVKFYSIYQICSPFSGWCIITTCVSSSVLWFS